MSEEYNSAHIYVFYRERPFAAFLNPGEAVLFMKSKSPYAFMGVGIIRLTLGNGDYTNNYVYLPEDFIKEFG